jgi:hypothetical protein
MSEQIATQLGTAESGTARDNHYVPQGLLQRWAPDGVNVHAYRTLVSHQNVPVWTQQPVRGSAYQRDLYTALSDARETDEVERWFADEYERPGLEASDRFVREQHINRDDWIAIIRFVALQHLRTPQSFFESMDRWQNNLPEILESTTRDSLALWKDRKAKGLPALDLLSGPNAFAGVFDVSVEATPDSQAGHAVVRTEVVLGRRFWLAGVRHLLTGVAEKLLEHQWSVWEAPPGEQWPLTDDPSLRLNYYAPDKFDFGGGWGKRGSKLMMPISPRHLLYTQVGRPSPRRRIASPEHTGAVQMILAQRAYRWIFGTEPYDWVSRARPRVVDQAQYEAEREMWDRWHERQVQAEMGSRSRKT